MKENESLLAFDKPELHLEAGRQRVEGELGTDMSEDEDKEGYCTRFWEHTSGSV